MSRLREVVGDDHRTKSARKGDSSIVSRALRLRRANLRNGRYQLLARCGNDEECGRNGGQGRTEDNHAHAPGWDEGKRRKGNRKGLCCGHRMQLEQIETVVFRDTRRFCSDLSSGYEARMREWYGFLSGFSAILAVTARGLPFPSPAELRRPSSHPQPRPRGTRFLGDGDGGQG